MKKLTFTEGPDTWKGDKFFHFCDTHNSYWLDDHAARELKKRLKLKNGDTVEVLLTPMADTLKLSLDKDPYSFSEYWRITSKTRIYLCHEGVIKALGELPDVMYLRKGKK